MSELREVIARAIEAEQASAKALAEANGDLHGKLVFVCCVPEHAADAVLAALEATGMVVVPVTPTDAMLKAAATVTDMDYSEWRAKIEAGEELPLAQAKWRAMLAAAREEK